MALVPVSRDALGGRRIKPLTSFAFAKDLAMVRMLAGEAAQVALNCPIVFLEENGSVAPLVMLGLKKGENLFVTEQGQWIAAYVPALLRRYPFFMGEASGSNGKALSLLVEEECLSTEEGEPLFGPRDDEPTGPAARAIRFLTEIAIEEARTVTLTKALAAQGLFEPLPLQVTRGTEAPVNLSGLQKISEARLNALSDDVFLEFRRSGALALAYAHLISLGQFARLQALATARSSQANSSIS